MRTSTIFCVLGMLAVPVSAMAHHAVNPNFDRGRIIEVEGTITELVWRNPHVLMSIEGVGPDGEERTWEIEANSVSNVSRMGLTPDLLPDGARIRVAGNPGRVNEFSMWLLNILLPTGEEVLFTGGSEPRWSARILGEDARSAVATDPNRELGLFRVWSNATPPPRFWGTDHPFTESALAARAAFDPVADAPTLNCMPKGMPFIMEQPYPLEIVDAGDVIEIRLEEFDTVRRIFMSGDAPAQAAGEPGILGRSTGRWDGETLVVETTDIDYPWFNGSGIPQSREVRIEERFALDEDGNRLELTMLYSDPNTFERPLTLRKTLEWRPGEEVRPFDCLAE